jgi:hypothetical protein
MQPVFFIIAALLQSAAPAACLLVPSSGTSIPVLAQAPPPTKPKSEPDDLSGRLIRKAVTETDEDLMEVILRLMTDSARKMEIDFDPGEPTRTLQKSIQDKIDEAIKAAAAKQRMKRQSPSAQSDRRRMPTVKKDASKRQPPKQGGSRSASSTSSTESDSSGGAAGAASDRTDLRDPRRGWGNLPQRQREEMIQGAGEQYLERYRAWVERYYRALQEKSD